MHFWRTKWVPNYVFQGLRCPRCLGAHGKLKRTNLLKLVNQKKVKSNFSVFSHQVFVFHFLGCCFAAIWHIKTCFSIRQNKFWRARQTGACWQIRLDKCNSHREAKHFRCAQMAHQMIPKNQGLLVLMVSLHIWEASVQRFGVLRRTIYKSYPTMETPSSAMHHPMSPDESYTHIPSTTPAIPTT